MFLLVYFWFFPKKVFVLQFSFKFICVFFNFTLTTELYLHLSCHSVKVSRSALVVRSREECNEWPFISIFRYFYSILDLSLFSETNIPECFCQRQILTCAFMINNSLYFVIETNVNYLDILCCEQESFSFLLNRNTTRS